MAMIQKNNEAMPVKNRIEQLIKAMSEGIWEKDYIFALGLPTAVAEESLFLLGPPGTGKSLVARRLKQVFKDSRSFEYLMSRFSTPDEIFGPVSIKKLKEEDRYERATDGRHRVSRRNMESRSGYPECSADGHQREGVSQRSDHTAATAESAGGGFQ